MEEKARKLIEKWIAIQRFSTSFGNDLADKMEWLINEMRIVIGDDDYKKKINTLIAGSKQELSEYMQVTLLESGQVYAGSIAVSISGQGISPSKALIGRALNRVFGDSNYNLEDLFENTLRNIAQQSKAIIQRGFSEGRGLFELRKDFSELGNATRRSAEMIARTSVNAVSNQISMETFAANDDIVDRWIYSSVLDSRTSDFCKVYSGTVFKVGEGPVPPNHPNCRSQQLPVFVGETIEQAQNNYLQKPAVETEKGYEQGDNRTRNGRIRKPRKDNKLKGTTTLSQNYETWLRKQPAAYQKDILGESGYKSFKSGKSLKDVVSEKNSGIDLSYLKKSIG